MREYRSRIFAGFATPNNSHKGAQHSPPHVANTQTRKRTEQNILTTNCTSCTFWFAMRQRTEQHFSQPYCSMHPLTSPVAPLFSLGAGAAGVAYPYKVLGTPYAGILVVQSSISAFYNYQSPVQWLLPRLFLRCFLISHRFSWLDLHFLPDRDMNLLRS